MQCGVAGGLTDHRLAAGRGHAQAGGHGLPEEGGGDVGLRGGRGKEPDAAGLVELREYPGGPGRLVWVLYEGLGEHPGP